MEEDKEKWPETLYRWREPSSTHNFQSATKRSTVDTLNSVFPPEILNAIKLLKAKIIEFNELKSQGLDIDKQTWTVMVEWFEKMMISISEIAYGLKSIIDDTQISDPEAKFMARQLSHVLDPISSSINLIRQLEDDMYIKTLSGFQEHMREYNLDWSDEVIERMAQGAVMSLRVHVSDRLKDQKLVGEVECVSQWLSLLDDFIESKEGNYGSMAMYDLESHLNNAFDDTDMKIYVVQQYSWSVYMPRFNKVFNSVLFSNINANYRKYGKNGKIKIILKENTYSIATENDVMDEDLTNTHSWWEGTKIITDLQKYYGWTASKFEKPIEWEKFKWSMIDIPYFKA